MPFRKDKRFSKTGFYTATGKALLLDDPQPEHIDLVDIAASLSRICRFGGNMKLGYTMYSVAQHSVYVSMLCSNWNNRKRGLLHDSDEAYGLLDFIRPYARLLGINENGSMIQRIRFLWKMAISQRYGIDIINHYPEVKDADNKILATEVRDLYYDVGHETVGVKPCNWIINPMSIQESYEFFLQEASILDIYNGSTKWPTL